MRLDKYVSCALQITRNDSKKLISQKKIKVIKDNIEIIKVKTDYNITNELVYYNDELLQYKEFIYIMMNKPKDVICSNFDNKQKTVFDLINGYKTNELSIVGRLDIDTTGLVLITNDGELCHKLTSPKHEHVKKYYVEIDNEFSSNDTIKFKEGITINNDGEDYLCKSAILDIIDKNKAYISITEGKFHQIKKMCKALNHEVIELKRISIASLMLDNNLKLGEYRELTEEEINLLK